MSAARTERISQASNQLRIVADELRDFHHVMPSGGRRAQLLGETIRELTAAIASLDRAVELLSRIEVMAR